MIGLCLKLKSLYIMSLVGLDVEGIISVGIPRKVSVFLEWYVTVLQVRMNAGLFLMLK